MSTPETCPKCSKRKAQSAPASITQWIFVCGCDSAVDAKESISVSLCRACGKRIEPGRPGSFTQWVFRADNCACENPEVIDVPLARKANDAPTLAQQIEDKGANEPELKMDPDSFPVERYRALKEIGHGGVGQVFLCKDRLLKTKVAVKCLRHASSEQLMLFQQEARATSKLSHSNIVKILDFGATAGGAPYMVMEFIEGVSLENFIKERGPLPSQFALSIVAQIADALAYSHSKNIFHRDIKSSNIILIDADSPEVSARVIDFGVSMMADRQESTVVQGRSVVGTPAYMSPDQVLGNEYDERSEVYSVGCVLFEALAGVPPFDGNTALEIISKHAQNEPPNIVDINPNSDCTDEVESIVLQCLAKERSKRFQSMAELRDACVVAGIGNDPKTMPDATPTGPEKGRPRYLLLAVVCLGLCVVAVGGITWQGYEEQSRRNETDRETQALLAKKLESVEINGKTWLKATPDFGDEDMPSLLKYGGKVVNLRLEGSLVTGKEISILEPLKLKGLNLSRTHITNESLEEIGKLRTLETLFLNLNYIDDSGVSYLRTLENLQELHMSETGITDNGVEMISHLQNLRRLSLDACENLTGKCFDYLLNLKNLKAVMIKNCDGIPKEAVERYLSATKNGVDMDVRNLFGESAPVHTRLQQIGQLQAEMVADPELAAFFNNPKNWNRRSYDDVKNPRILKWVKNADMRKLMHTSPDLSKQIPQLNSRIKVENDSLLP